MALTGVSRPARTELKFSTTADEAARFATGVSRLARIELKSADPHRLARFYVEALGFVRQSAPSPAAEESLGAASDGAGQIAAGGSRVRLVLGSTRVDLVGARSEARPYPADVPGWSPLFQHFAIVVSDMSRAIARLGAATGWRPISLDGPQRLPASAGGVTAFKFRDPEGHPLELLFFPEDTARDLAEVDVGDRAIDGAADDAAPDMADVATGDRLAQPGVVATKAGATNVRRPDRAPASGRDGKRSPFLRIDHSAISAADVARSIAFYQSLGLRVAARSLNLGPAQERLDAIGNAQVDVVALEIVSDAPIHAPHVELLGYRDIDTHGKEAPVAGIDDIAATRLVFVVADRAASRRIVERNAERLPMIEPPPAGARVIALLRDPDGHLIQIESEP